MSRCGGITLAHNPVPSPGPLATSLSACRSLSYLALCALGLADADLQTILEALRTAQPPLHTLRLGNPHTMGGTATPVCECVPPASTFGPFGGRCSLPRDALERQTTAGGRGVPPGPPLPGIQVS